MKREVLPLWAEVLFSVNLRDPVESPAPMMLMQNILQHFVKSWMTIRSITRWQNLERSISAVAEPSRIILSLYGMEVIDSGVAVLNMHAPWEVTSKADVYEAYKCYMAFLKDA